MSNDSGFDFGEDPKTSSSNTVTEPVALGVDSAAVETPVDSQNGNVQASEEEALEQSRAPVQVAVSTEAADNAVIGAEKPPAKTYTQDYVDNLERQINQVKSKEGEAKKCCSELERSHFRKEEAISNFFNKLEEVNPDKWNNLCALYVLARNYAELKESKDKLDDIKSNAERLEEEKKGLEEDNKRLEEDNKKLTAAEQVLKERLLGLPELQKAKEDLDNWKNWYSNTLIKAIVPRCLANKDWFTVFWRELEELLFAMPPSDAAILVLASLSEFAVMERSPATACFDWKKQLTDIGLVLAKYMHQKRAPEPDVIKILRDFSAALSESPTIAQLKIEIFIPTLGTGFNIDRVKHLKNGSSIAKVLNWGIIDSNGPYAKAIVE